MSIAISITRPAYIDNDTLDASTFDSVTIIGATVPSATNASEGVIQLAGDLAGTATTPVVAGHAVTFAKFQQIATDNLVGRATAGTGDVELVSCTAAGRALIAAADVAAQKAILGVGAGVLNAVTTAQFNKTTDTTLADIPGLSASVNAATTYSFEAVLFCAPDTAGNSKVAIGGTCTATAIIYDMSGIGNGAGYDTSVNRATAMGTAISYAPNRNLVRITLWGTITVNAAGTLTVKYAQNTSSGTSSVLVGSYLRVWAN